MNLIHFHIFSNRLYKMRIPMLPKVIYFIQFLLFNSILPASTKIGKKTFFAYGGIGVVVHGRASIGNYCILGQGITIGGRSKEFHVPKIGNYVYIGPGARVLGNISIGDNVIIGPNSVVIDSVPSNCIVVGIPAKIIKKNIKIKDYI